MVVSSPAQWSVSPLKRIWATSLRVESLAEGREMVCVVGNWQEQEETEERVMMDWRKGLEAIRNENGREVDLPSLLRR